MPTDGEIPQKINSSQNSGIEVLNLKQEYLDQLLQLLTDLGYSIEEVNTYTGDYNQYTFRVNSYTYLDLFRHGYILAESFVYGNSIFLFNTEQAKLELERTPGLQSDFDFKTIAQNLNRLTKQELEDFGGCNIPHNSGYIGKIKAIIQSTNQSLEDQSDKTANPKTKEKPQQRKTPEEWMDEFRAYAENKKNYDKNGNLQPPRISSENPGERSLATLLSKIRIDIGTRARFTKEQLDELRGFGFNV